MIVITNPDPITNEINTIHSLFENGLELLHVRKPDFSAIEMSFFLSQINPNFRKKLVLHSHYHLASVFGIDRIHFSEKQRFDSNFNKDSGFARVKSTSTHSIEAFNSLKNEFDYSFLSPIYPSISKPDYISEINHLETIIKRTNFSTKLVALGGICSGNMKQTLDKGFDEVALLGFIWNSTNSLENFKKCQKIVLSF